MANLYKLLVSTTAEKEVQVVANSPEEATAKVVLQPGETVVNVTDGGEVTV